MRSVAIAGGGIGGLTAALCLLQQGFEVRVFERAPQLAEIGAGLSLGINATRVLYALGLGPALERVGVIESGTCYRHGATGALLRRISYREMMARHGVPYLRLHRWDLQAALLAAIRERDRDVVVMNAAVEDWDESGDRIRLAVPGQGEYRVDVLIGADGIRSRVRERLFGAREPEFAGYVAWRALVPAEDVPAELLEAAVSFGDGHMINHYLVRRGALINVVAFARRARWEAEGWTIPATRPELMDEFAGFDAATRHLLSRVPEDSLFRWGLFSRPRLERWVRGRVGLLGDAAHPMLPFMGQGSAMAIEDAMILARALGDTADPELGLRRYQEARYERVQDVTDRAASQAELFHGDADSYSLDRDRTDRPRDLFTYDAVHAAI